MTWTARPSSSCLPRTAPLKHEVIIDRMTSQSKGFGFVQMSSDAEAQAAIDALNGKDFQGRAGPDGQRRQAA